MTGESARPFGVQADRSGRAAHLPPKQVENVGMQTAACFDHLQVLVLQASGISKGSACEVVRGPSGRVLWNDCKERAVFFSAQGAFRRDRCLAGSPERWAKTRSPRTGRGDRYERARKRGGDR